MGKFRHLQQIKKRVFNASNSFQLWVCKNVSYKEQKHDQQAESSIHIVHRLQHRQNPDPVRSKEELQLENSLPDPLSEQSN